MKPRYFLGLETGGTKAVASLLDDAWQSHGTREAPRPASATAVETIAQLGELGNALVRDARVAQKDLTAIGWGFGGHVDRAHNEPAANFHETGWGTVAAAKELAARLGAPVFVENDCKVAALAEAHLGAGSPDGLTAYVTLGSGVGGGLVWNGKILASGPRGEGEIGHITIVPSGARCACGRLGCLEAYCSGWGFGERIVEAIRDQAVRTPLMETIAAADYRRRTALLFSAYPQDSFAREQVEHFLEHLAGACTTLCLLLAPGHLVIGGGIAQQTWIAGELESRLNTLLPDVMRGTTRVRVSKLGTRCVSYGAALYAADKSGQAIHRPPCP